MREPTSAEILVAIVASQAVGELPGYVQPDGVINVESAVDVAEAIVAEVLRRGDARG